MTAKLHDKFDSDLAQFRRTFNDRVECADLWLNVILNIDVYIC